MLMHAVGVSGSDGAVFIPQASPQLEAEESEGQRGRGFERGVGMLANLRAEHLAVHNSRVCCFFVPGLVCMPIVQEFTLQYCLYSFHTAVVILMLRNAFTEP